MNRSNLVRSCDCCDNQLSQISIPHINDRHRKKLSKALIDTLLILNAKGECSMLCIDEMIVAINYTYANAREVKRAEEFCENLFETADDFFQAIIDESEVEYCELDTN